MPRKLEAYTEEVLAAISDIESFVSGLSFDIYSKDEKTKSAVALYVRIDVVGAWLDAAQEPRN